MYILRKNYLLIASLAISAVLASFPSDAQPPKPAPNILFIIMDDVGIDQMKSFGYGNLGPSMPIVDAIAQQVHENLSQPGHVPAHPGRNAVVHLVRDIQFLLLPLQVCL